jgi:hypothetical protein
MKVIQTLVENMKTSNSLSTVPVDSMSVLLLKTSMEIFDERRGSQWEKNGCDSE